MEKLESMEELSTSANVLLLGSTMDDMVEDACAELLRPKPPATENVLLVTLNGTPDRRLAHWREQVDEELPAEMGLVDRGSELGSGYPPNGTPEDGSVTVRSVPTPGNLTQLGVAISSQLDEWEGNGNQSVVCFRSITALLQYVEPQPAYRLLNAITRRIASADASAHYHMDPGAHDEQTVHTFESLFDAVAAFDDGKGRIATR